MSNQQWPPPGGRQDSPWAHQDPGHAAPHFHDAGGRDPRAPFGQAPTPPPPHEDLRPPRPKLPLVALVVAVVVVIGAFIGVMQLIGVDDDQGAAPATTTSAAPAPSESRSGLYIPFEGNGDGIFQIAGYEWNDAGLVLQVRVEIEHGEYQFGMFAFTNDTREAYDPLDPRPFTVRAGQPYEAEVVFDMPRADSTIVLSTPSGAVALNALAIPG